MHINELDTLYLVPLPVRDLAAELGRDDRDLIVADGADELVVRDGDMIVLQLVEQVLGGCVVRLAPILGDARELASFCEDHEQAATLVACEEAAERIETVVQSLGGMAAGRLRGKWRPFDESQRFVWAGHVARANAQRMRKAA